MEMWRAVSSQIEQCEDLCEKNGAVRRDTIAYLRRAMLSDIEQCGGLH